MVALVAGETFVAMVVCQRKAAGRQTVILARCRPQVIVGDHGGCCCERRKQLEIVRQSAAERHDETLFGRRYESAGRPEDVALPPWFASVALPLQCMLIRYGEVGMRHKVIWRFIYRFPPPPELIHNAGHHCLRAPSSSRSVGCAPRPKEPGQSHVMWVVEAWGQAGVGRWGGGGGGGGKEARWWANRAAWSVQRRECALVCMHTVRPTEMPFRRSKRVKRSQRSSHAGIQPAF